MTLRSVFVSVGDGRMGCVQLVEGVKALNERRKQRNRRQQRTVVDSEGPVMEAAA